MYRYENSGRVCTGTRTVDGYVPVREQWTGMYRYENSGRVCTGTRTVDGYVPVREQWTGMYRYEKDNYKESTIFAVQQVLTLYCTGTYANPITGVSHLGCHDDLALTKVFPNVIP
jgi:hypothetical protein